jgi:RNA polymerase sigma-70 factor (ECF subfamily)
LRDQNDRDQIRREIVYDVVTTSGQTRPAAGSGEWVRAGAGEEGADRMTAGEAVFHEVMERYGRALRRVAATYEADPALRDDLFQEICLALWRSLARFRAESSLATFVFRIAHNRGLTHAARRLRLRSRERPGSAHEDSPPSEPVDREPTPEGSALVRERSERLHAAVRRLPLGLRQVVTLRLEGLDDAEISEVVGISPGNVAVRLTRARQALRELLV